MLKTLLQQVCQVFVVPDCKGSEVYLFTWLILHIHKRPLPAANPIGCDKVN